MFNISESVNIVIDPYCEKYKGSLYYLMVEQCYDYYFDKPFKKYYDPCLCKVTYTVLKEDEKWWEFWLAGAIYSPPPPPSPPPSPPTLPIPPCG